MTTSSGRGGLAGVVGRWRGFPRGQADWPATLERPRPARRVGVDYDTGWARRYPVRMARALLLDGVALPAVRALARPGVVGAERTRAMQPPVVFAANHASHLDTPIILASIPGHLRHRTVVAAAADHFFDTTWKAATWAFIASAVPIERTRVERRSAHLAANLLGDGWNLLIYPEGGRSPDGWARPFRGGAAYLAKRTGAPIVPVHLSGTRDLLAKGKRGLSPGRTRVSFGTPLVAEAGEDARRLARRLEAAVARLADESASDWWSAARRAATGTTPPPSGPDLAAWRRAWALPPARRRAPTSWPRLRPAGHLWPQS